MTTERGKMAGEARMTRRRNAVGIKVGAAAGPAKRSSALRQPKRLSSVATAIALLKSFSETNVESGVSELARSLGVAKSTVHRLAVTLVSEGMLERNPDTGKYRLGLVLFGLGALVRRRMKLSSEARQDLFALREATQETVQLAVLDDTEVMYVYNLESTQAIRVNSDIGVRKPAFCTASGRAILAFQPQERVRLVLERSHYESRSPKSVTDPAALLSILAEVRERGYATEDEESDAGMRAVAAPIRNEVGAVVASVAMAAPAHRLARDAMTRMAPLVITTAGAISTRLGYRAGQEF